MIDSSLELHQKGHGECISTAKYLKYVVAVRLCRIGRKKSEAARFTESNSHEQSPTLPVMDGEYSQR